MDEIIKEGLHEYLDRFQTELNSVDDSISSTFFTVGSDASRKFGGIEE
jgi:uncharacterized alpha-E superfamily protein